MSTLRTDRVTDLTTAILEDLNSRTQTAVCRYLDAYLDGKMSKREFAEVISEIARASAYEALDGLEASI